MPQTIVSRSKQIILEPVEDVDSLAGSLGKNKAMTVSIRAMKVGARRSIAKAGRGKFARKPHTN
ncbi:MAG TPA: hypothetical protein VK742_19510 [Candidatus Sulfotelmatobacter sp.]|jgi:hypothetical protein|nr:hypothetical protein [Candidatus Sulfotelmatobacter sp.]